MQEALKYSVFKEYEKTKLIEVEIEFKSLGNQAPYFSMTGTMYEKLNEEQRRYLYRSSVYGDFLKYPGDKDKYYIELFEYKNELYEVVGGGCCHDEILKVFPQFEIFKKMHLADEDGIPFSGFDSGFYFLRKYKNPEDRPLKALCQLWRITEEECEKLLEIFEKGKKDRLGSEFHIHKYLREELSIIQRWKEEAELAKEYLITLIESKKALENMRK